MTIRSMASVAALAWLLSAAGAQATVIEGQSFEEMAARTPVIVRGVVGAQQVRWDDGKRRIHTYTELRVTEVLKGDAPPILLARQPGGEVGGVGQRVVGAARFRTGEEVLLFLETPPDDQTVFVVRALGAGKVSLEKNGVGQVRATRDLRGLAVYDPSVPRPVVREAPGVEDLGDAQAFLQRVRAAVAAAQGGAR